MFFVVGNGPSLRKSDLSNLPDQRWLGMNSAYRYWDKIDKYPKYYACLDPVVIKSHAKQIYRLYEQGVIEEFFLHDAILEEVPELRNKGRITFLDDFVNKTSALLKFSKLSLYKQTTGALATRFCIEKGEKKLCLIGIDCNYVEIVDSAEKLEGNELVINGNVKNNPNYFFEDYQSHGDLYQIPNPRIHSGNLHLQSFIALQNDIASNELDVEIVVGSSKSLLSKYSIFETRAIRELLLLRRIECVAVPIIRKELDAFLQNLELWVQPKLQPSLVCRYNGTMLHIFLDCDYDTEIYAKINNKIKSLPDLKNYFSGFKITFFDFPPSINYYKKSGTLEPRNFCTKSGPNIYFLAVMEQCRDYEYTLQMEADCIPLKAGWLDAADNLVKLDGNSSWIIGPNYFGPTKLDSSYELHINGNAIYATGNSDYQHFLGTEFQTILKFIISSGVSHMAYDTSLSFVFSGNNDIVKEQTGVDLRKYLVKLKYTDLIANYGGRVETEDPSTVNVESIINNCPDSYLGHGRLFQDIFPRLYSSLQSYYSNIASNAVELTSTSCWSNNAKVKSSVLGFGRVKVQGFPAEPTSFCIYFNNLDTDKLSQGVNEFRFGFSVATEDIIIGSVSFRLYDANFKSEGFSGDLVKKGSSYSLSASLDKIPKKNYEIAALIINAQSKSQSTYFLITDCFATQSCESKSNSKPNLIEEKSSDEVASLIDNWQKFIKNGQDNDTSPVRRIFYTDFSSNLMLLRDLRVRANNGISLKVSTLSEYNEADKSLHAVCSFHGCLSSEIKKIRINTNFSSKQTGFRLRLCRNGTSLWEFKDFDLQDGLEIDNPFTTQHEGMRIEVISCSGPITDIEWSLYLEPLLQEEISKPQENLIPNIGFSSKINGPSIAEIILNLKQNSPENIESLIPSDRPFFVQSLVASFKRSGKYKWLLPTLVGCLSDKSYLSHLPRIIYFDPVHRNTASATQELRKRLMSRYPKELIVLIHPSWQKPGYWEVTENDSTEILSFEETFEKIESSENAKVVVRTGFNDKGSSKIYERLGSIKLPVISYVMDTWDLRLENSLAEYKVEALNSFEKLLDTSCEILTITEEMSLHIKKRYNKKSSAVVHNYIPDNICEILKTINQQGISKRNGKMTYLYSGGLEEDMTLGGIVDFIDCAGKSRVSDKIKIVVKTFRRHEKQAKLVEIACKKASIEYQIISDDLTIDEYEILIKKADVYFLSYIDSEEAKSYVSCSYPNKLSDYFPNKKPILYYGPDYSVKRILHELNTSGFMTVDNKADLILKIEFIENNYEKLCLSLNQSCQRVVELFGEEEMQKRFIDVLL